MWNRLSSQLNLSAIGGQLKEVTKEVIASNTSIFQGQETNEKGNPPVENEENNKPSDELEEAKKQIELLTDVNDKLKNEVSAFASTNKSYQFI